jgi:hypothetical protein
VRAVCMLRGRAGGSEMQNLSHLAKGPVAGSSMSAGNGITDMSWAQSAPGSASEQTSGEPVNPPVNPVMTNYPPSVTHPEGIRDPGPWTDAHAIGQHPAWSSAAPDESGGNASASRWTQQ